MTSDIADLVTRLRANRLKGSLEDGILADEAATALEAVGRERDEALLERDKFYAIAEDKLADTRLMSAGGHGEGFGFDFTGGPIPYIAEYLFQFIGAREEKCPSNYAEIEVQHNTFGAMTLTLQRRSGQTPHQLRAAAEAALSTANAEVERLKVALKVAEALLRNHPTPYSTTDGGRIPMTSVAEAANTARLALQQEEALK